MEETINLDCHYMWKLNQTSIHALLTPHLRRDDMAPSWFPSGWLLGLSSLTPRSFLAPCGSSLTLVSVYDNYLRRTYTEAYANLRQHAPASVFENKQCA